MDRVSLSPEERIVTSFNVTVVQVYALTSEHDNNEIDNFYQLIQEIIKIPEKDRGGWGGGMHKFEEVHRQTGNKNGI